MNKAKFTILLAAIGLMSTTFVSAAPLSDDEIAKADYKKILLAASMT